LFKPLIISTFTRIIKEVRFDIIDFTLMERGILNLVLRIVLFMHKEWFCFFLLCVLIILPSWFLHGTFGLVIAILVTPAAHKFFYARIMLNEDGTFRDRKSIEEELERLKKPNH
jgi:hypothetical protein